MARCSRCGTARLTEWPCANCHHLDTLRAAITDGQEEPEDSTATTFRGPGSSCPCRVHGDTDGDCGGENCG